jgi:hypothetical protein
MICGYVEKFTKGCTGLMPQMGFSRCSGRPFDFSFLRDLTQLIIQLVSDLSKQLIPPTRSHIQHAKPTGTLDMPTIFEVLYRTAT